MKAASREEPPIGQVFLGYFGRDNSLPRLCFYNGVEVYELAKAKVDDRIKQSAQKISDNEELIFWFAIPTKINFAESNERSK